MLNKIIQVKKEEMKQFVLPEKQNFPSFSLYQSLTQPIREVGLIAEIKKASPSKGIIRENFSPLEIAKDYTSTGVDALSVLTDEQFFQGSKKYLTDVKSIVNVPVLRKDFIVDRRQLLESKHLGADVVLLIGIPKYSNTSALPLFEETARFPCFATLIPSELATIAEAVEILKVETPSPPVPHVSINSSVPSYSSLLM